MDHPAAITIPVRPSTIRNVLLAGLGVLFALDLLVVLLQRGFELDLPRGIASRLDSDTERSFPTLYNVGLLFLSSVTCALVARLGAPRSRTWLLLGLVFLFLTADESLQLHEALSNHLSARFDLPGFLYFAWVVPYALGCLALLVLVLPWYLELPAETRRGFFVAAVLFGLGVFVLESSAGYHWSRIGKEEVDLFFDLSTAMEEGLEMLGIIVFIDHAVRYASTLSGEIALRWVDR